MLKPKIALLLTLVACSACATRPLPPTPANQLTLEYQQEQNRKLAKEDKLFDAAHKVVMVGAVVATGGILGGPAAATAAAVP
jgi:hypothetical protein